MKNKKQFIIAFIIFSISFYCGYSQDKVKLNIVVTGIKHSGGNLEVGLYNNTKNFPKDDQEYLSEIIPVTKDKVEVSFNRKEFLDAQRRGFRFPFSLRRGQNFD
jgi:uncharacterized protein (DUF2141 family)